MSEYGDNPMVRSEINDPWHKCEGHNCDNGVHEDDIKGGIPYCPSCQAEIDAEKAEEAAEAKRDEIREEFHNTLRRRGII